MFHCQNVEKFNQVAKSNQVLYRVDCVANSTMQSVHDLACQYMIMHLIIDFLGRSFEQHTSYVEFSQFSNDWNVPLRGISRCTVFPNGIKNC